MKKYPTIKAAPLPDTIDKSIYDSGLPTSAIQELEQQLVSASLNVLSKEIKLSNNFLYDIGSLNSLEGCSNVSYLTCKFENELLYNWEVAKLDNRF